MQCKYKNFEWRMTRFVYKRVLITFRHEKSCNEPVMYTVITDSHVIRQSCLQL